MRELLTELNEALEAGRPCVYCVVVETRGSTPQKAGAAMLVFPDGSQRGTLGGDGAEQAHILTFSLDDNYGWDDGLICGGRMSILAEPLARRSEPASYYRRLRDLVSRGHGCIEAIVISESVGAAPGSRYLFNGAGEVVAQIAAGPAPIGVKQHLPALEKRPRASVQHGIAYLPVLPRITLLIVGGGHVGQAVAKLGADVDFDVWVLDDRATYVTPERFPMARRRLVGDIGATLKDLAASDITSSVYCLIVTRGHAHDEEALYHLATTNAGYVGMIGSKRKIKLIYEDLVARGISQDALKKVHAPLGFDIGSQTVPEIAVSIVAELIACRNLGGTIAAARIQVPV